MGRLLIAVGGWFMFLAGIGVGVILLYLLKESGLDR